MRHIALAVLSASAFALAAGPAAAASTTVDLTCMVQYVAGSPTRVLVTLTNTTYANLRIGTPIALRLIATGSDRSRITVHRIPVEEVAVPGGKSRLAVRSGFEAGTPLRCTATVAIKLDPRSPAAKRPPVTRDNAKL